MNCAVVQQRNAHRHAGKPELSFVVEGDSVGLVGTLLRALIEQRFPEATCSVDASVVHEGLAARVVHNGNGRALWVVGGPLTRTMATAIFAGEEALELTASRTKIDAALNALIASEPTRGKTNQFAANRVATTGLTPRQAEVARLVAEGMSDSEIGVALRLSVHTVRTHLRSASATLGVRSRARLAAVVREMELSPANADER